MSEHEELFARRPYNAAADFVDGNVARGNGGKVAFKEKDRALTYGELQAASCRFGRGLYKLGLRPESRMVVLHLDTIEFPIAFWGAIRAGVIPIPLNTLPGAEVRAAGAVVLRGRGVRASLDARGRSPMRFSASCR